MIIKVVILYNNEEITCGYAPITHPKEAKIKCVIYDIINDKTFSLRNFLIDFRRVG